MARTVQELLTVSTPQIVVTKHHDEGLCQIWAEGPFAASIEAIAVDQREDILMTGHDRARCIERRPVWIAHHLP